MTHETAYIALGSNLGPREETICSAIEQLDARDGVRITRASTIIETEPQGDPNQPRFLNAVVEARTTRSPRQLLDLCLEIEAAHGRVRRAQDRWGPRTLDLDLLLYGEHVIDEPGLVVPHPRLTERLFVLQPLTEIAPHAKHPVLGERIECLYHQALHHVNAASPGRNVSNRIELHAQQRKSTA